MSGPAGWEPQLFAPLAVELKPRTFTLLASVLESVEAKLDKRTHSLADLVTAQAALRSASSLACGQASAPLS